MLIQQNRNPIAAVTLALLCVASCGPKFAPPGASSTACRGISETAFKAAKEAGAAHGRSKINANGNASLNTGPGISHCSSFKGSKKVCRRPNDFVIHYTLPDGRDKFVLIPKDSEYRLNFHRKPIPCEVITQNTKGLTK